MPGRGRRPTRRVGQFAPTPGPFYDLGGNVLEWTADTHTASRAGCWRSLNDPFCQQAATTTGERYLRGWSDITADTPSMRAASRLALSATTLTTRIGFRCARSL